MSGDVKTALTSPRPCSTVVEHSRRVALRPLKLLVDKVTERGRGRSSSSQLHPRPPARTWGQAVSDVATDGLPLLGDSDARRKSG
jgi:hypothetical protein